MFGKRKKEPDLIKLTGSTLSAERLVRQALEIWRGVPIVLCSFDIQPIGRMTDTGSLRTLRLTTKTWGRIIGPMNGQHDDVCAEMGLFSRYNRSVWQPIDGGFTMFIKPCLPTIKYECSATARFEFTEEVDDVPLVTVLCAGAASQYYDNNIYVGHSLADRQVIEVA